MSDIQLIDKPFTKVLVRPERGGDRHSRLYNKEMNLRNNRTGHVTNTTSQTNPVSYIYFTVCCSIAAANTILLLYYILSISYFTISTGRFLCKVIHLSYQQGSHGETFTRSFLSVYLLLELCVYFTVDFCTLSCCRLSDFSQLNYLLYFTLSIVLGY